MEITITAGFYSTNIIKLSLLRRLVSRRVMKIGYRTSYIIPSSSRRANPATKAKPF